MSSEDELDDFMDQIAPLTPEEKTEMLLSHLMVMLESLEISEVETMGRFVRRTCPPGEGRDTLEELLEGHLALRRLRKGARDEAP